MIQKYMEIMNNKKDSKQITNEQYAKYISKLWQWQINSSTEYYQAEDDHF
ncbi:hypothetical protein J2W98_003833 [Paenibacillus peoriae]|uniref:Uncharacterized protein n=1 Tax=Paenibacillus peoriae TaxID=59893 RepID=A0ABU1QJ05_9BACL|nr:hypothetical protein [Paenibacillus peoriae]